MARMSLSDYLLAEIKEIANRPTLIEFRERLRGRTPVNVKFHSKRLMREDRDAD